MANSADQGRTMRAMAIDEFGGPEMLTLHELPIPKAGAGEFLIKVPYAGVGVWDAMMRQGLMEAQALKGATLPRILGADGPGTSAAVGEGVGGAPFHRMDDIMGRWK